MYIYTTTVNEKFSSNAESCSNAGLGARLSDGFERGIERRIERGIECEIEREIERARIVLNSCFHELKRLKVFDRAREFERARGIQRGIESGIE